MTIKPYYQDNFATQYNGHVLNILPELQPESIQCCVTSPPYWGLRDYGLPPQIWDDPGGCEHEWGEAQQINTGRHDVGNIIAGHQTRTIEPGLQKASSGQFCQLCGAWRGSLGLEPTPELYIQHIVQIFREVKRVLRKDGTLWLNLGDSYASGKGSCFNPGGGANSLEGHAKLKKVKAYKLNRPNISDLEGMGLKPKDLCMIPARVALALQEDGWWLRSDIIWAKPNPMPESVTDRPTRAHEYVFLLTKSGKYFYDADAVREAHQTQGETRRLIGGIESNVRYSEAKPNGVSTGSRMGQNPAGRNLRSVWTIATEPTPEAHFATFPEKLVIPCIKAGTSEKGCCPECGAPWVRMVEKKDPGRRKVESEYPGKQTLATSKYIHDSGSIESKTIGWKPSCKCGNEKTMPCTVLDCFSGSGKVLTVAKKLFRKAIGIELNADYCEMPLKKLKPGRLAF